MKIKIMLEAYLELRGTSMMKFFYENSEQLSSVNYFHKNAPS